MMKHRLLAFLSVLAFCLYPVLQAGGAGTEIIELSCGKVEYLEYRCTLPDGRLVLTGGTRRAEYGGDAAWIMCLNTDRTVSWEYISRKDGFTSAEEATVLEDGTLAVIMEDYPKKRAAVFFTPDGKKAGKALNLKKKRGVIYAVTPSFIMTYDSAGTEPEDYRCLTFLYNWKGKETARFDGLIMRGGYGFLSAGGDECVAYGHDTIFNSHAMIQKLDESMDRVLWETLLDWQLPGSDTARLECAVKTGDGGYISWLREGRPGENEWSSYDWKYLLVKFDAEGHLLWVKGKEEYGQNAGQLFLYNGKVGILCEDSSRIDADRYICWLDEDGKILEKTEIRLNPGDFTVLRDYLEPDDPEEKRTTIVDQQTFIPMDDGLWTMATCWAANDLGEEGFSTIYDSQEIVFFRIPDCSAVQVSSFSPPDP